MPSTYFRASGTRFVPMSSQSPRQPRVWKGHNLGPTNFVIIGSQRVGTTWFRTLLDSHPRIRCYGEVLNLNDVTERSYPKFIHESASRLILHHINRKKVLYTYLDELLFGRSDDGVVGFKLMYSMMTWWPYQFPMAMGYVRERRLAVIHLTRRNVLQTHISRVTARTNGVWHTDKTLKGCPRVTVPAAELLKSLDRIRRQDEVWTHKLTALSPLSISYEELVNDFDAVSMRILAFLNVDPSVSLKSSLKKINPNNFRQIIENYDAVRNTLTGTPYEKFLDEDQ